VFSWHTHLIHVCVYRASLAVAMSCSAVSAIKHFSRRLHCVTAERLFLVSEFVGSRSLCLPSDAEFLSKILLRMVMCDDCIMFVVDNLEISLVRHFTASLINNPELHDITHTNCQHLCNKVSFHDQHRSYVVWRSFCWYFWSNCHTLRHNNL